MRRIRVIASTVAAAAVISAMTSGVPASAAVVVRPVLGPAQTVATADGHIQVFAIGGGRIWQNWQNPVTGRHGNWVGQDSPITFVGTPAVVSRPGQPIVDIFGSGPLGGAVETWYNWATGKWGGFIGLGGTGYLGGSDPSVVAAADGNEWVAITSGGKVWANWFSPATGHTGAFATPALRASRPLVGRPSAVLRADGTHFDVFARTISGNVLETWYSVTGAAGGWIDFGGSTAYDPAAIYTPADPLLMLPPGMPDREVIVINAGKAIALNWFEPSTGHKGGWAVSFDAAPVTLVGPLALTARRGRPQFDIFVRGLDGQSFEEYADFSGVAQGGWVPLAGSAITPPAATTTLDSNEQVVTTLGTGAVVDTFTPSDGAQSGWRSLQ